MKKVIWCLLMVLSILSDSIAQRDTFTIMQYNLLMYPNNNPNKGIYMRPILNYLQPDVITVNELTSSAAVDSLYSGGLDTSKYVFAPFFADGTLGNGLIYNKQRMGVASSKVMLTSPRKTQIYKLYNRNQNFVQYPDTVFMTFFVVHLKSSTGTTNQTTRLIQATDLRDYTRIFQPSNFILGGDFNLYTSTEPAYQKLLEPGDHPFYDPIDRPGSWNNNASFKDIHTQSPRTTSFDGGVTGGLDDRFDFLLVASEIVSGIGGVRYIPGTYHVPGNDGNHFNLSIVSAPVNTSAPDSVIQALHLMSDHLPVVMKVEMDPSNVTLNVNALNKQSSCCDSEINQTYLETLENWMLLDMQGRVIKSKENQDKWNENLRPGMYVLQQWCKFEEPCSRKILISK
jgi:endonuclease/exonuclease/phosphatase family metal-dependent hydrolase